MKKRMLALLTAGLLSLGLCMNAFAAQEPKVGKVLLTPYTRAQDETTLVPVGINTLMMEFERDDVSVGEGTITVIDDSTSAILCRVDVQNDLLVQNVTTKEDKGTVFMIVLPKDPKAGHSYRVKVQAGCFTSAGNGARSLAIDDPKAWYFTMDRYGFTIVGHDINNAQKAGDEVSFDIRLCEHAPRAVISAVDEKGLMLDQTELLESGIVTGKILDPKTAALNLTFYAPDGEIYNELVCTLGSPE